MRHEDGWVQWTAVIVVVLAVVYGALARRHFDFGADPAAYAGVAASIIAGDGYWFNGRPHTLYPPGYPVLLVPVSWLSGDNYAALSAYTAVLAAIAVGAVAWYSRERLATHRWVPVLMVAFSAPYLAHAASGVASEAPYTAVSVAFLACIERLSRAEDRRVRPAVLLSAALLLVATMAIRGVGLALFAAAGLTLVTRSVNARRNGTASRALDRVLLGAMAMAVPYAIGWAVWTSTARTPLYEGEYADTYGAQFRMVDPHEPDLGVASPSDIVARIPAGLVSQTTHAAELLTNAGWLLPVWYSVPMLLVLVGALLGIVREVQRPNPTMGWYVLSYAGLLVIWPFESVQRFLLPVFPLVAILVAAGLTWLVRAYEARKRWAELLVFALPVAGVTGSVIASLGARELSRQELASLVAWIALAGVALLVRRRGAGSMRLVRSSWLPHAFLIAFVALGARSMASTIEARIDSAPERNDDVARASQWIRANTAPTDVIMAFAYSGLHYATGRSTVPFPVMRDPERLQRTIVGLRPDYLLVEAPKPYEYFTPTQNERLEIIEAARLLRLREVARFDGTRMFRVLAVDSPNAP